MKYRLIFVMSFLLSLTAWGKPSNDKIAYIIPADFSVNQKFIKVSENFDFTVNENIVTYHLCHGNIENSNCEIYQQATESKLKKLQFNQNIYGSLLMATEVVGGGLIWKNLMKFSLPLFHKLVRKQTGWSEDIAVGTVALIPASLTTAGVVVVGLQQINQIFESISPMNRYHRSDLLDTGEMFASEMLMTPFDLNQLLREIKNIHRVSK